MKMHAFSGVAEESQEKLSEKDFHPKTQFLISGLSPLPNPKLILDSSIINTKEEMKHLGFKRGFKGYLLTFHRHNDLCISEMWATTSSLVSCGIRWTHPNIVANIFSTLVIPKVLYGIEITNVNKYLESLISKQCRSSLKSLWGLSKHSRNDLNKYYNLADMSKYIKTRKIKFLQQLMKNRTT